ncbi:MAG: hypothetical protein AB1468_03760, partial [Candidatus Micrarchaeota archaeon]
MFEMQMTGLFFSMMTIALVTVLLLYTYNYLDALAEQGRESAITVRAIELGNFADSISLDFPRVLEISAKRSLYAAIDYIDTNGVPLDDAHLRLVELIKNGTLYGSEPNLTS